VTWARYPTLEAAEQARAWQQDGNLLWRVRLAPSEREPGAPWALKVYRWVNREEAGMATAKLEPGPLRDALGLLVQATRGEDSLTVHDLCDRTGVGFVPMRARVESLVAMGYATRRDGNGVPCYQATERAAELIS
jgi:hypothetical protein